MCKMKVDNAEYALITAIVIFSDRKDIREPKRVEKIQVRGFFGFFFLFLLLLLLLLLLLHVTLGEGNKAGLGTVKVLVVL